MQIIHSVDDETHRWLKVAADADGCGVGEIVRRCIAFARQETREDKQPGNVDPQREMEAKRLQDQRRREHEVKVAMARRQLEELLAGEPPELVRTTYAASEVEQMLTAQGPAYLLDEPHAEEIEVPADPDDLQPEPLPTTLRARPSMLEAAGRRPGSLTRPAGANPEVAFGTYQGDGVGNVTRANFKHLGFASGKVG